MSGDTITILRAQSRRLAKFFRTRGTVEVYDSAKTFDLAEVKVTDLDHLGRILRQLLDRADLCIVRGAIADPDRTSRVRRLYHPDVATGDSPTIRDTDHYWIGLDVEGVARPDDVAASDLVECARLAVALLPGEFRGVRCIVQASASHGIKEGCRLRLWYWASRPVSGTELTIWLRRSPVDACLFRPAQITYTAAPVFESGIDHLPCRIADLPGDSTVPVPAAEVLQPPKPAEVTGTSYGSRRRDTPVEQLIARSLFKVRTAGDGERHNRLRAAARTIGGVLEQSGISRAEAAGALMDAVRHAAGSDLNVRNASDAIAWGLAIGAQSPLRLSQDGRR
jgi:hypothetical protein